MVLAKNNTFMENRNTCLVFAHRGSKCNRPENTLAAFQEALRIKTDGIELDVHLSKDDQLVVIHDEKVNRTTSGKGRVRNLTLAELKQLDAGSWFDERFQGERIPTLHEVLDLLISEHFTGFLNIELKTDIINYPGIEEKVLGLVSQQSLPFTIIYSSFNINTLQKLHALGVKDEIAYLAGKKLQKISLNKVRSFMSSLHLKKKYVLKYPELLAPDSRPLRLWGIDSEADMRYAFQHNIAGIFTDFPEKALKIRQHL